MAIDSAIALFYVTAVKSLVKSLPARTIPGAFKHSNKAAKQLNRNTLKCKLWGRRIGFGILPSASLADTDPVSTVKLFVVQVALCVSPVCTWHTLPRIPSIFGLAEDYGIAFTPLGATVPLPLLQQLGDGEIALQMSRKVPKMGIRWWWRQVYK